MAFIFAVLFVPAKLFSTRGYQTKLDGFLQVLSLPDVAATDFPLTLLMTVLVCPG